MPELEPPPQSEDPIAKLHKMSTTAGVGSQDYVAINNAAIVSVILGICTALAFLGIPFLVIGIAGIVSGIMALVQIRHSNGTQGGTGIAILGILLSLAIAGSVGTTNLLEWLHEREDRQEINSVLEQLGQHISADRYDKAFGLFTPGFQAAWKLEPFKIYLQTTEQYVGKIARMSGNNVVKFDTSGEGVPVAATQVIMSFRIPTSQPTTQ